MSEQFFIVLDLPVLFFSVIPGSTWFYFMYRQYKNLIDDRCMFKAISVSRFLAISFKSFHVSSFFIFRYHRYGTGTFFGT
jgi:hypothetical protein